MLAHDFARSPGGKFLLRIEDIDQGRCRDAFVDAIFEDLAWLGIRWDGQVRQQSEHMSDYAAALARLRDMGLAYPCFCTRADIAAAAGAPHGLEGPVYPGTCRTLPDDVREARMGSEPHAWRLDMEKSCKTTGALEWTDHGRTIAAEALGAGDIVIARKDAGTSYHLAVVVDDALQGVTDVVRGEDLFEATHAHRVLQSLLGLPTPRYHHHPLLKGPDGKRLAKRDRAETIAELRSAGVTPAAIRTRLGI